MITEERRANATFTPFGHVAAFFATWCAGGLEGQRKRLPMNATVEQQKTFEASDFAKALQRVVAASPCTSPVASPTKEVDQ